MLVIGDAGVTPTATALIVEVGLDACAGKLANQFGAYVVQFAVAVAGAFDEHFQCFRL